MKTAEELALEIQSPHGIGWEESIRMIKARDAAIRAEYAGLVEDARRVVNCRHTFEPSEHNRDTCGRCGKNFRDVMYHFTTEPGQTKHGDLAKLGAALDALEGK